MEVKNKDQRFCPVCGEYLNDCLERCFRCETDLKEWWNFEIAGRNFQSALRKYLPPVPSSQKFSYLRLAIAIFIGLGIGFGVSQILNINPPLQPSLPPQDNTIRRYVLRYVVQPGDSLWHISAALTGEGHRWKQLWPDIGSKAGTLLPGTILEVPFTCDNTNMIRMNP